MANPKKTPYFLSLWIESHKEVVVLPVKKENRDLLSMVLKLSEMKIQENARPEIKADFKTGMAILKPALAWVIQLNEQGFRENQYPFSTNDLQEIRPLGVFFSNFREVCYQLLRVIDMGGYEFPPCPNSNFLWGIILNEVFAGYLERNDRTLAIFQGFNTKKEARDAVRLEARRLLGWENPFSLNQTPKLHFFIGSAIKLKDHDPAEGKALKKAKKNLRTKWKECWESYRYAGNEFADSTILQRTYLDPELGQVRQIISGHQTKVIYPSTK